MFSFITYVMKDFDESILKHTISQLCNGNEAAFNEIYFLYRRKVKGYSLRLIRNPEEAEELTQIVFIRLWEKRASIDPDKNFDAFLFTITRNLIMEEFRRKARFSSYEKTLVKDEPSHDAIDSYMDYRDVMTVSGKAIASLPAKSKQVFELSREHGNSYAHISGKLNISTNTVHSHMAKSLKHIRRYFSVYSPETILIFILIIN